MRKLGFTRKPGFIIGIIVLLVALMPLSVPVNDSLPAQAAEPPVPVPTEPPSLSPPQYQPPPMIDGHGTGALPSMTGVVHISEQALSDGSLVGESPVAAPPASFDWRTQSKVTSVKNQLTCGACYAFAGIGNVESKVLIDTSTTTPGPNYSENNAKSCTWRAVNNWTDPSNYTWGNCYGGNYKMLASLFSQKGIVLETDDPYVASNTACNSSCPYNKTLLDWRIISTYLVPNTTLLKNYIQANGPVYTHLYVGDLTNDPAWYNEFGYYDGSYNLYYTGTYAPNHAVLIVGWDDTLNHTGGSGCWIVKNSWGTTWGAAGYFTIAYGSASIGTWSSYMYDWQDYDNNGSVYYYDDDCQNDYVGYSNVTGWGLCNFTPSSNTYATRVEFWTVDTTTDIDIYIYDDFNVATKSLSNLLRSQFNYSYVEPGYHSVPLSSPLPLTAGDPVIVVVKFTDASWGWPVPTDQYGPNETALTYTSPTGTNWSWYDVSSNLNEDVCIRLRTSTAFPCTCGDICVNETGWWRDGGIFNASATPIQSAVDNATGGETICVKDGTYHENVDVNTANLTIKSENGAANCVVNASDSNDHVFNVSADWVNITGFTVQNATGSNASGIYLYGVNHCNISNNVIRGNSMGGIYLNATHNSILDNNTVSHSMAGIGLENSSYNNVTNNNVRNTSYAIAVWRFSHFNRVINNTILNTTNFMPGPSGNYSFAIEIFGSSNNTVDDNYISNTTAYGTSASAAGIFVASYYGPVNNNTITSNEIYNTTASGTNASAVGIGVTGGPASNNTIANNELCNATASGVGYTAGFGIYVENATDNKLLNNTVSSNDFGIISSSASINTIASNTVNLNNYLGIVLLASNGNTIYNNYFNNTDNAEDDGNNTWNTTNTTGPNIIGGPYIGGNYWSDYTGSDTNQDGFGETPYNITGGPNKDYLPLVSAPVRNIDTGEGFYAIQAAIDAVNTTAGHTITVDPGTYNENVDVNKQLTIRSTSGNASDTVVNAANSTDHVFYVTANYVNITGFTVENATGSNSAGIYLLSADHCNLSSNNATNNYYGVYLRYSNNSMLANNTANWNSFYSIYLCYSSNNTLINNTASHNTGTYGIYLASCSNNTLQNNDGEDNNIGIRLSDSSNNTLDNNTENSNEYGIWLSQSSNNNTLINNTANSNNHTGIYLWSSSNDNTLTNNTANSNNEYGIYLDSSNSNNTLRSNTVCDNDLNGIRLVSSSNNTIYNNYFSNTNNAYDDGTNTWNTTNTTGPNIIGGPYIGGNYWSDYTGSDTNGDGFGDTGLPYNGGGNIQNGGDYLPLVVTGATLEGHVAFPGRGTAPDSRWIEQFNVTLFEAGNLSHVIWTGNATTNDTGVFSIPDLDPDTYDIRIKGVTSVSELEEDVTLTAGNTTVVDFGMMREGDCNGDNWITGADRNLLYTGWGSHEGGAGWNPDCDLNADDWLTGADRNLMYTYWGQSGD
jgi:parallel beta-helix repeat protein